MMEPIKLGVSACLLGEKVRWDGGHRLDPFLTGTLGQFVEYVPVCPEAECGLGVPREAMRLVGDPENPRLVTVKTGVDHTDRMKDWGTRRLEKLAREELCGCIFKSRSPSCAIGRVKVYGERGLTLTGTGVWARMVVERFPLLPVEDEGRLTDPEVRENFIERIFVFRRWRDLTARGKTLGGLVRFHDAHKLLIMAHSPRAYRELGALVASGSVCYPEELFAEYIVSLVAAMKLRATVKKHRNVLLHIAGYFKRRFTPDEKREFVEIIDRYALGRLPLIVPVTLVNHYTRKYGESRLENQYYLNSHPIELTLRNHA